MGFFKDLFGSKKSQSQPQQTRAQAYGEMASDLYASLNLDQKWAILSSQFMFAEFAKGTAGESQAAEMGIFMANSLKLSPSQMQLYLPKYANLELMVKTMKTINNRGVLDSVLYNSYGICALSGKPSAMSVLYQMYSQLGYSKQDVDNVIEKVEALGRMMRNL